MKMTIEEYKSLHSDPQPKYRNAKAERRLPNGRALKFDSQKEAARFDELMLLMKAGEIAELKLQPQFTLIEAYTEPDGESVSAVRYVADFSYVKMPKGFGCNAEKVVEDCKGYRTREFETKKKLLRDRFGIKVLET